MTLSQYLTETETPQRAFAQRIEVSPGYLHDILHGRRTPGLAVALRIAAATDGQVPVESFLKASEASS